MLDDDLPAAAGTNDALDGVRRAALDRARPLTDLLERHRTQFRDETAAVRQRSADASERKARRVATEAAIDRWLTGCGDDEGRAAVLCVLTTARADDTAQWVYVDAIAPLVRRVGGWTPEEAALLLSHLRENDLGYRFAKVVGAVLDVAEGLDADGRRAAVPGLQRAHAQLTHAASRWDSRLAPLVKRLRVLLTDADDTSVPEGLIPARAPWAASLRERADTDPSRAFADLVRHLASLSAPRPTGRWARACAGLVEDASAGDLVAEALRVLAEGERQCSRQGGAHNDWIGSGYHYHYLVHQRDADLARGAVWAAALTGGPAAAPLLAALAVRAGGTRSDVTNDLKLAGAAINALGASDDPAAMEALSGLRARIKDRALRKQVDTAHRAAAERQGITPQQLVERGVPDHGLAPDGTLERDLGGGYTARLAVEDAATVRITFVHPGGRESRTAPAAVKDQFPDQLRAFKALAKEIRATLAAERARVEALLSTGRSWPWEEWRRYYRDQPITGVVVRGLIVEVRDTAAEGDTSGDGGGDGDGWRAVAPGAEPGGSPARVRLWHPVRAAAAEIGAWRERIVADRLRQPFKQAFREIYRLTPAEEETAAYSNRYAAHIVDYARLYALFKERGWQANYLGRYDGGYDGIGRGEFDDGRWRACFHHEPAADDDGVGGAPEHAATDQVRFERRDGRRWREASPAEVPPLVLSEAMRDIDLFVAVSSVANDPTWIDRGPARHHPYWRSVGFGELTASAEVRREALTRILPRLRIADRCVLEGRFLVVRGDLRTYRIHLGSANILMAPDDAYLCVVPSRDAGRGTVFLPFEDDRLGLILSKAFLLAADTRIKDPSILRQIG